MSMRVRFYLFQLWRDLPVVGTFAGVLSILLSQLEQPTVAVAVSIIALFFLPLVRLALMSPEERIQVMMPMIRRDREASLRHLLFHINKGVSEFERIAGEIDSAIEAGNRKELERIERRIENQRGDLASPLVDAIYPLFHLKEANSMREFLRYHPASIHALIRKYHRTAEEYGLNDSELKFRITQACTQTTELHDFGSIMDGLELVVSTGSGNLLESLWRKLAQNRYIEADDQGNSSLNPSGQLLLESLERTRGLKLRELGDFGEDFSFDRLKRLAGCRRQCQEPLVDNLVAYLRNRFGAQRRLIVVTAGYSNIVLRCLETLKTEINDVELEVLMLRSQNAYLDEDLLMSSELSIKVDRRPRMVDVSRLVAIVNSRGDNDCMFAIFGCEAIGLNGTIYHPHGVEDALQALDKRIETIAVGENWKVRDEFAIDWDPGAISRYTSSNFHAIVTDESPFVPDEEQRFDLSSARQAWLDKLTAAHIDPNVVPALP